MNSFLIYDGIITPNQPDPEESGQAVKSGVHN